MTILSSLSILSNCTVREVDNLHTVAFQVNLFTGLSRGLFELFWLNTMSSSLSGLCRRLDPLPSNCRI